LRVIYKKLKTIIVKKILINILKFALFLSIGLGIMGWLYTSQDAAFQENLILKNQTPYPYKIKLINDLLSVNPFWLVMTLLAFSFSNYSRAVRWNMLMKPLGYRPSDLNSFFAVNISYFTNLFLSRAGEVVRASSLAKVEGMSVSKVMGTVVVDRLLDMVSLILIVGFGFLVEYDTLWNYLDKSLGQGDGSFRLLKNPIFLGLAAFGVISLGLLFVFRKKIQELPLFQKVRHIVEKFTEGLKTIKKIENLPLFIFHSVNIWVMYYMMTFLCFYAFAPTEHLPAIAALTVFVFGTFGIVIPSPGGMGTYHFLATAALVIHGVNGDDAFSFANIMFFTVQIFYSIVIGSLSIFLLYFFNRHKNKRVEDGSFLDMEEATAAISEGK
jgi:glycosyltransferase 2 family protein